MIQRRPGEPLDLSEWQDITLDFTTLTLTEAAEAEAQSGWAIGELATGARLRLLAMFVHGLRNYEPPPSWRELGDLRALSVLSSTSRPSPAGPPPSAES